MNPLIFPYFMPLVLLTIAIEDPPSYTEDNNETRHPRVNGRIVKLYSGPRPDPIYCSAEGFQPDPLNCVVFYRCVKSFNGKFTVFRYQCGLGTVFDPETDICNHPRNTKRAECGGINIASSNEHLNEIDGSQSELPSPISTKAPAFSQSAISTYNPGATSQHQNPETSSAYPWSTSDSSQRPVISSYPSSQSGDVCTSDGFMGDSEDCRKFYRCISNSRGGFIRYEYSCTDSTIWDDAVQTCNHPWAVQRRRCGRGNVGNQDSSAANKPNNHLTISNEIDDQQTPSDFGVKIPQHPSDKPKTEAPNNYKDQQNYYGNVNYDVPIMQTPNYNNYVDSEIQKQDNTKDPIQTTKSQSYYTSSMRPIATSEYIEENNHGYNSQHQSMNEKPTTQVHDNKQECTQSGFMGDQNDCTKFYRCVDNSRGGYIKYEFTCGEGTVWDSKIEACNHAWAVKDCHHKVPEQHSTTPIKTTQNYEHTTKMTSTSTTTQNYYSTTSSISIDEDVGYGNQNQPTTAYPNMTMTTGKSDNDCSSSGFFGNDKDCKKFYRCVDNGKGSYTMYEFLCGDGTFWDSEIEACNHAWAVKNCGSANDINKVETTTRKGNVSVSSIHPVQTTTQQSLYNTVSTIPETEKPFTTTTTKKPQNHDISKNGECKTSGFMGDRYDCNKFYRCVDNGDGSFTRYEFSCGEGTVWDSKIEACNHAWAVEKCGVNSTYDDNKETSSPILNDEILYTTHKTDFEKETPSTEQSPQSTSSNTVQVTQAGESANCHSSGFMGDNNNCKKFYRCVDNGNGGFTRYEFSCGEGTVWDQSIEACNHDWAVKNCENTHNNTTESSLETTSFISMTSTETEKYNELEQEKPEKPLVKPQDSDKEVCMNQGFVGDSNNCRIFFRCVDNGKGGYIKYKFTCGEGTVWDQEIQSCNHESSRTNCSRSSSSTMSSQTPSMTSTSSPSSSYTTIEQNSTPTDKPSISEDPCASEGFFANTADCKKFYRCVDNGKGNFTKYEFTCGQGTVWVQEIQACDHDGGVRNCSNKAEFSIESTITENIEDNKTTPSTIMPSTESDKEPVQQHDEYPTETSSSRPIQTNDKCTSEGFFANKDDCTQFYRCVDNGNGKYIKYDYTCGEGTAWDSNIQTCNHISEVKTCGNTSGDQNQSLPVMQDEEISNGSTDGNMVSSSTETNPKPASESSNSDNSCKEEGFYGNSNDCTKFYRCVDNGKGSYTKYDFTCAEGTIWDQALTTCNHPQDVSNPTCKQTETSSTSSESEGSSSTSSSNNNNGQTTSSPIENSSQASSSTTEKNQNSSDCSQASSQKPANQNVTCTKAGYYPDPNDCKKFYRCVDWDGNGEKFSVYYFECGEGTIWDPALDTCNHEESVYPPRDCSGQSQSENQESSTNGSTTTKATTTQTSSTTTSSSEGTTQQSTTRPSTESTTTQKPTTSAQTTTQQSTTNEQTTQQSEHTTTQEPTISEQTTTQQSTTSEQTTTQQSTTNAETTQQPEQSTTQKTTTTSEPSTQQTTTSEQATTQQSTTSKQTTTQLSSTTEQTSTKQTTPQQSTTSENQQSTIDATSQQTTQQSSATEESTTQSSTTDETTTQKEGQQSTTGESSTTESTESTTSSTTQQNNESSTTESSESTTESSTSSNNKCPETDADQNFFVCPTSFRRHPKYCNLFYQCTEDDDNYDVQVAVFHCPNNTIYDENQTKCIEESKSNKKCDGEIAQRRRVKRLDVAYKEPIVVSKEEMKCPNVGYYSFEKEECSSVFLKCQNTKSNKLRGFIFKCPEGYLYWSVSKRCEKKSNVEFCKSSSVNNWRQRWEIPTEKRNVAL